MTESYADIDKAFPFYGNATHDGAHFTFNFFFITRLNAYSKAQDVVNVIHRWMDTLPSKYVPNWVVCYLFNSIILVIGNPKILLVGKPRPTSSRFSLRNKTFRRSNYANHATTRCSCNL